MTRIFDREFTPSSCREWFLHFEPDTGETYMVPNYKGEPELNRGDEMSAYSQTAHCHRRSYEPEYMQELEDEARIHAGCSIPGLAVPEEPPSGQAHPSTTAEDRAWLAEAYERAQAADRDLDAPSGTDR